jgi:hypothetical protein
VEAEQIEAKRRGPRWERARSGRRGARSWERLVARDEPDVGGQRPAGSGEDGDQHGDDGEAAAHGGAQGAELRCTEAEIGVALKELNASLIHS